MRRGLPRLICWGQVSIHHSSAAGGSALPQSFLGCGCGLTLSLLHPWAAP